MNTPSVKKDATPEEVELLGRDDGRWFFEVYEKLIQRGLGPAQKVRAEFEKFAAAEMGAMEHRLRSIECTSKLIRAWRRGCVAEFTKLEKTLLTSVGALIGSAKERGG
jgi:hypothetical protein